MPPTPHGRARPHPPARDLAALLLVLGVSASAFGRVFSGDGWVPAVLAPAVGVPLVDALAGRWLRAAWTAVIDVVALALLVVWGVLPGTTVAGVPTPATGRALVRALAETGPRIEAALPPVAPSPPFLVLGALGVGLAALAACRLRRWRPGSARAVVPALLVYVTAGVFGTGPGRDLSVGIEVGAVAAYLLAARARPLDAGGVPPAGGTAPHGGAGGGRWRGGWRPVAAATAGVLPLALVVGMATAATAGANGSGPLGWHPGSRSPRVLVNPLVRLSTRLAPHNAPADLFTVRTTDPSYWQLTTLDEFSGSTWAPGQVTYVGIGSQLPGTRAPGPGRQRETFTVQSLGSPWLPTGLDPLAIHSATPDLQYSARTGSILSPRSTSNGLHYTVTSSRALLHLTTADLAALPPLQRGQAPPRSLQLPADLPRSVGRLARRITAGAHTEVAKAVALQAYFHGPQFRYSLHPPIDGSGVAALTGFLFVTHTGYCQQFAASFAALARSIGLPTRLAVGFTTGTPIGHHTYEVTDADVHTWPEVWFPKVGWVPFEPTKGNGRSAFAIPGAPWTGAGGSGTPALATTGTERHGAARGVPAATRAAGPRGRPAHAPFGATVRVVGPVGAAGLAGLLVVVAGALAAARRLRRRRRSRRLRSEMATVPGGSRAAALLAWEQLVEALARLGIDGEAADSAPDLARRAARDLGAGPELAARLLAAARAADAAAWAPEPGGAGDAGGGPVPVAEITDLLAEVRAVRRGGNRGEDRAAA